MKRKRCYGAAFVAVITVFSLLQFLFGCSCKSVPAVHHFLNPSQIDTSQKSQRQKVRIQKGMEGELTSVVFSPENLPVFEQSPYTYLNDNVPPLLEEEIAEKRPFERYAELDCYGRCGTALACVDRSLMPKTDREPINELKPSGWVNHTYSFIENAFLYNRCHLIGYQLTAENANERNLITGTRYFNIEAMLPFENAVGSYIRRTGDAVMYRVTPYFVGEELLCRGVTIEAYSVKDHGRSLCYYVYCHNVQPGVVIDYATGENHIAVE